MDPMRITTPISEEFIIFIVYNKLKLKFKIQGIVP